MTTYTESELSLSADPLSIARKSSLLVYGVLSYIVGCIGLTAVILAMAGLIPLGQILVLTDNNILATIINLLLICLFGLQHSIMARPFFKQWQRNFFTAASERSTFVWSSGVTLMIIIGLWQPVTGSLWNLEGSVFGYLVWGWFVFGWGYLFAATFSISHWDLFGLRQIWFAVQDQPYEAPQFKENWMYRYSRHPIMLGALIGMWCVPNMTATKLIMTLLLTAYIFIGVAFEERDLIKHFGQHYIDYKKRVGMFFTFGK